MPGKLFLEQENTDCAIYGNFIFLNPFSIKMYNKCKLLYYISFLIKINLLNSNN